MKINVGILCLAALMGGAFSYLYPTYIAPSLAIKDPNDPRFRAEDFRFYNYPGAISNPHYSAAIKQMFPLGVSEEYVDSILISKANAEKEATQDVEGQKVHYRKLGRFPAAGYHWAIKMRFNRERELVSINILY